MIQKTWRIDPEALREAEEASDQYESRRAGTGEEFAAAVEAIFKQLSHTPRVGSVERHGTYEIRRAQIGSFPYWMVFAELSDEFLCSPSCTAAVIRPTGARASMRSADARAVDGATHGSHDAVTLPWVAASCDLSQPCRRRIEGDRCGVRPRGRSQGTRRSVR
jgi:hypothetical protein